MSVEPSRTFEILAFIVRMGRVIRLSRESIAYGEPAAIPQLIARAAMGQVKQGRYVLVLENGSPNWTFSRIPPHARKALEQMSRSDALRFFRNTSINESNIPCL